MSLTESTLEVAVHPKSSNVTMVDLRNTTASIHLDAIRALAAFAVLIFHVRYRCFLDYRDLSAPTLTTKAFYAITSFGHDAVMIFFVLSGFLISASIMRDHQLGRFSWGRYLVNRLTRLYVVLIPGLLLTLFWDSLGLSLFASNPIYRGVHTSWIHDYYDVSARLTPTIAVGNLFFLQTSYVPEFGSDAPLWSLAFEFWYYCLFPLIYVGVLYGPTWIHRMLATLTALAIASILSRSILYYFPIWLLGALLCTIPQRESWHQPVKFRIAILTAAAISVASIVFGHLSFMKQIFGPSTIVADYATGIGFAIFLYVVMHDRRRSPPSTYAKYAQWTAGFSYTLYVIHIPLLVFMRAALVPGRSWEPTPGHVAIGAVLAVICVGYAMAVASVTEAKTEDVRDFVMAWAARCKNRRVAS